MPERLVDVERKGAEVLHTFPVTVSPPADDEGFQAEGVGCGWLTRSWSLTRNSRI